MKYKRVKEYGEGKFRRIAGVRKRTFRKMSEILGSAEAARRAKGGPKPKLGVEDMLLPALEYWREYRTFAHIVASFDLSESQMFRIVRWVEDVLIKDGAFRLPGKKVLLESGGEHETIQMDATESPVERPKKAKVLVFRKEEAAHNKDAGGCLQKDKKNNLRRFCKREAARFQAF